MGTPDIVWKKALRALRNRCRARLPEELPDHAQKLELLSALLAVVALKISDAAKTLDRFELNRNVPVEEGARILFERLRIALPFSLQNSLPAPDNQALKKASEVLKGDEKFDVLWQDPGALGYVYQIWGHTFRNVALNAVQTPNKELSRETLISFTQVYTPPWVIEFLLDESLTKILAEQKSLTGIRLLDPACGAGHFLLKAFDILKKHYATMGMTVEDSILLILEQNLHGVDIDAIGLSVCALSLILKASLESSMDLKFKLNLAKTDVHDAQKQVLPLGSIDPVWLTASDMFLSRPFDVVVTNPPYIGRRLLSRTLKDMLSKEFPLSKSDLSTAFIEGSLRFLRDGGLLAAITQASLLVLPSYLDFRKQLERDVDVILATPCGTGVFPLLSGEKADSLLLVLQKNASPATARRPFATNKAEQLAPILNHAKAIKLSEIADIRQGLATTDNRRFVRYRWEVAEDAIGTDWVPYLKGAGSERWVVPTDHVVRWKNSGEEIKRAVSDAYPYLAGKTAWVVKNEQYYFKEGLCFSFINKDRLAVRELPPNFIFDVASSAIFASLEYRNFLFGYLNSSIASAFANSLNPTINLQVGDLKRIPVPEFSSAVRDKIASLCQRCVTLKRSSLELFEPKGSSDQGNRQGIGIETFSDLVARFERNARDLKNAEAELDNLVFEETANAFSFDSKLRKELQPIEEIQPIEEFQPTEEFQSTEKSQLTEKLQSPSSDQIRKSLAARFVNAWSRGLIRENGFEHPQILTAGFFANDGNSGLQHHFAPSELDRLEKDLGVSLAKYLDKRRVVDLARGFRGPARYLSVQMPVSKATLLLSAKALKTFASTEKIEAYSFSSSRNGNQPGFQNDWQAAAQECSEILKTVWKELNKIENWSTQDLIEQLDARLEAQK